MPTDEITFQSALDENLTYLSSLQAFDVVRADPYWPKWDSPWWRMTLLWEMGHASLIPKSLVSVMVDALNTHYLPDFPQAHELPPGVDPYRQVICHCAVGTMFQVLHACAVDVDEALPWMRPWLYRYQLPDGGLNCDERAYAKPDGKSSIVSTVPALEAVLRCGPKPFDEQAAGFLERGARYLLRHRLFRRASGDDSIIETAWLEPTFPRFYFYDVLRGLSLVAEWAEISNNRVPRSAIDEAFTALSRKYQQSRSIWIERRAASTKTSNLECCSGVWKPVDGSRSFPLLEAAGRIGRSSSELTAQFERTRERLEGLARRGLLHD